MRICNVIIMDFNKIALTALGKQVLLHQKEGVLYIADASCKNSAEYLFNKKVWCRLRDNFLFIFEGINACCPICNTVVLENCDVHRGFPKSLTLAVHTWNCFPFYILLCDGTTQVLASETLKERSIWVEALQSAKHKTLRIELDYLTSCIHSYYCNQRTNVGSAEITKFLEGVQVQLHEITFSCTNLPRDVFGRLPSSLVTVDIYCNTKQRWITYGRTEVVKDSSSPCFASSIPFFQSDKISSHSLITVTVLDVKDIISNTTICLGSVTLLLKTLQDNDHLKIPLQITESSKTAFLLIHSLKLPQNKIGGHLNLLSKSIFNKKPKLEFFQRTRSLPTKVSDDSLLKKYCRKWLCNSPILRTYRFSSHFGTDINLREFMAESCICFIFPRYLLDIWICEQKVLIEDLIRLGELNEPWNLKKSSLIKMHLHLLEMYNGSRVNLQNNSHRCFKRSTEKSAKNLEFVPTNLHIQKISVDGLNNDTTYEWITVGAFTAHSVKTKTGGLKKLMQEVELLRKSNDNREISVKSEIMSNAIETIENGKKEIFKAVENLRDANRKQLKPMLENSEVIVKTVNAILNVCEREIMKEAFSDFEHHIKSSCNYIFLNNLKIKDKNVNVSMNQTVSSVEEMQKKLLNSKGSLLDLKRQGASESSDEVEHFCKIESKSVQTIKALCLNYYRYGNINLQNSLAAETSEHTNINYFQKNILEINIYQLRNEIKEVTYKLLKEIDKLSGLFHITRSILISQDNESILHKVYDLQYRRDICFSQALTSLVTGLMEKIWQEKVDHNFIKLLMKSGPLACFECLLSLHEEGHMWEDMYIAVKDLEMVSFKFTHCHNITSPCIPKVLGTRKFLTVLLPVPYEFYDALPSKAMSFNVRTVFFTMGVNEMAAVAEEMGLAGPQYESNIDNFEIINQYYLEYVKLGLSSKVAIKNNLEEVLNDLKINVYSRNPKNIQVLHLSSKISRLMNGLIIVSCKSAKDRTGMFITLDQTQILVDHFYLADEHFKVALNCMRSTGCRLENTLKNTGVEKFAFNSLQFQFLPKLYRPPPGTYGSVET